MVAIPSQHIESYLSISYVGAVVAKAGHSFNIVWRDYGVDFEIREIRKWEGVLEDGGVLIDCQLKASTEWKLKDGYVVYDLSAKAYNKLTRQRSCRTSPYLLVLYCLPKNSELWLSHDENQLLLRKCCYWHWIAGEPAVSNSSKKRIYIPQDRRFTPEFVAGLRSRIDEGEFS